MFHGHTLSFHLYSDPCCLTSATFSNRACLTVLLAVASLLLRFIPAPISFSNRYYLSFPSSVTSISQAILPRFSITIAIPSIHFLVSVASLFNASFFSLAVTSLCCIF